MVRIGFIGCGAIGRTHLERLTSRRVSGGVVTGVFDVVEAAAKSAVDDFGLSQAKVFSSAEELIASPDVDAVVICSRNDAHLDPLLHAIEAGKPVFTEKPMTISAEDSLKVVDAELKLGRRLVQVGFNWRFDPGFDSVKKVVDSGKVGPLLLAGCRTYNVRAATSYYGTDNVINDTLIHNIDILHYLFGEDYKSVEVRFSRQNSLNPNPADVLREPQLTVFEFQSGALATVECNVNCQYGFDVRCRLVGEQGIVTLPDIPSPEVRYDGQVSHAIDVDWVAPLIDSYDNEFRYFLDQAEKGEGPELGKAANAWDGYLANVTSDAALKSLHSDTRVEPVYAERPALYV